MDYTVTESLSERVPNGSKAGMRRAYAQQKLVVFIYIGGCLSCRAALRLCWPSLPPDALRLLTFSSFYYSYFFLFIIFIFHYFSFIYFSPSFLRLFVQFSFIYYFFIIPSYARLSQLALVSSVELPVQACWSLSCTELWTFHSPFASFCGLVFPTQWAPFIFFP